jgi:hypothetical protein
VPGHVPRGGGSAERVADEAGRRQQHDRSGDGGVAHGVELTEADADVLEPVAVEGLPSILVGVAVLFFLDDGIQAARWLSADEKALLAANVGREEGLLPDRAVAERIRSISSLETRTSG